MKVNKKNSIFLLGGHDLEMKEIKDVLIDSGFKEGKHFFDKNLLWDNAILSAYDDILKKHQDKMIYGIELSIDIDHPNNFIHIDHHNENSHKKASLLQVLELLGKKPTRDQKLIAANDSRYIDGMKCIGATEEEIKDIRQRDRNVQGITPQDETAAKNDVRSKKEENGITVVCATTPHFSAISDELYFQLKPYNPSRYIIYNDEKIVFYGLDFFEIEEILTKQYNLSAEDYYLGGGSYGYLGIKKNKLKKEEIKRVLKSVLKKLGKRLISSHIFLFPFRFDRHDKDNGFTEEFEFYKKTDINKRVDTKALHEKLCVDQWSYEPFKVDNSDVFPHPYNEYAYFYDYVRDMLYNKKEFSSNAISNFYRKKSLEQGTMTFNIASKDNFPASSYTLVIDGITLRVFNTGIAILGIELLNYEYSNQNDILRINDYGRRVYPQFIGEGYSNATKGTFLADSISIHDREGKKVVTEEFVSKTYEEVRIGDHIMQVLGTNTFTQCKCPDTQKCKNPHIKKCNKVLKGLFYIQPSLDDRMFVHCWYGSSKFFECLKSNDEQKKSHRKRPYLYSNDWYRFLFVDNDTVTVKNKKMRLSLLKDATYDRWSEDGMLFGISRYSFMLLTNEGWFPRNIIYNHMNTMYFQMSTMLLANRTSILRFSDEVAAIASLSNTQEEKRLSEIYSRYLEFFDRLYFREVTHQDQGIELYDIGLKQMRIPEHINKLDSKFTKLHDFAQLKAQNRESEAMNSLNLVISALGVTGLFVSFYSMGAFDFENSLKPFWWAVVSSVFAGGIALWGMSKWLTHKKGN